MKIRSESKNRLKSNFFGKAKRICGENANFAALKILKKMDKQHLQQIIAAYFTTQPVLKAWLFGSYARGEQREDSDIDIMVVLDSQAHVGLFKLSGMRLDLQDLLSKEVDLVTEKGLLPFARQSAENDKILLYERAN